MKISELVALAFNTARSKGWHDGVVDPAARIPEKLCLIHSEVSEALEDYRKDPTGPRFIIHGHDGKPEGFPIELADIVIRVADLAGSLGIDLEGAIVLKTSYNETRPHRHGGKAC